jgi:hypothetical protein
MTQIINVANAVEFPALLDGELMEALQNELTRLVQNMADPNTVAVQKRTMDLHLELTPSVNRDFVDLKIKIKSSCNQHNPPMRAFLLMSIAPGREGVLHVSVSEHQAHQQSIFEPAPENRLPMGN